MRTEDEYCTAVLVAPLPIAVILMGVPGAGKTTVGQLLAERNVWTFRDADDFHSPSNVAKMRRGSRAAASFGGKIEQDSGAAPPVAGGKGKFLGKDAAAALPCPPAPSPCA